jgi:hypothetical protein
MSIDKRRAVAIQMRGARMSKKANDVAKSKKTTISSPHAGILNRMLAMGNYFSARRLARQIISSSSTEADQELARYALRKTKPDIQALLAGAACLSTTIVVACLVAY